jgi:schlafen family protein
LLLTLKGKIRGVASTLTRRYRARATASALQRQAVDLNMVKRENWTEADVDALPADEHDYFERKSGQLFTGTGDLLGKLAKTLSAMANSGGGHIILGVDDAGVPDGIPCRQRRRPSQRLTRAEDSTLGRLSPIRFPGPRRRAFDALTHSARPPSDRD